MKVLIAPDKFKDSLTSFELCDIIADAIGQTDSNIILRQYPMADGGDGFASVMHHYLETKGIMSFSCDPIGRSIQTSYQWNEENKTAIIELASASGYSLLKKQEQNPLYTSTYGTGLQIKNAIEQGALKIILGLGGSATNDAGIGILAALGFRFIDEQENILPPCGNSLNSIHKIILPPQLPDIEFEIACDVQNVLHGPDGAAFVYAPQKGANADEVEKLDEGLRHFSDIIYKETGKMVADIPGTGAAGGIAAGIMSFFRTKLISGTEMIIDHSGIRNELTDASLIVTGEGKIDEQTKKGKVVGRIAQFGFEYNIPVIAFCGMADINETGIEGLKAIIALADDINSVDHSIKNAKELLQQKVKATLPLIISGEYGSRFL